ncbi:MAG: acetyl-CoA C-acetyltransferase [Rickettsiales bacterium]
MALKEVYIVDAARTAIGSFLGSLKNLPASRLAVPVIERIVARNKIDKNEISELIIGQVLVAGQGQNPARQTSILSGIPASVPAYGVSHVCGSGIKSVMLGAQSISLGQSGIVIAGGQESMSQAHHSTYIRQGIKMGSDNLSDTMISDGLTDAFENYHMGLTAENVAEKYSITREEQDIFAANSQNKAEKAQRSGKFKDEIVPIKIFDKKKELIFEEDEFIRHGVSAEILATLKPAFKKEGTVTAGNASGLNDGASFILLMNEENVKRYNLTPKAVIRSYASCGVDPAVMGIAPVESSKKALQLANWKVEDLDLVESNEAFAAQAIAVNKQMSWDANIVNKYGGAIALGHPIGASGTRILTTLLYSMQNNRKKKGLATLCIGGGMSNAICIESY